MSVSVKTKNNFHRSMGWLKSNIFSSPSNTVLSLVILFFLLNIFHGLFDWSILSANFAGSTREACSGDGACWVFIKQRINQIIYGYYPNDSAGRVYLSFGFIAISITGLLSGRLGPRRLWILVTCFIMPVSVWFYLKGGFWGLEEVDTSQWGGLLVTIIVSFVGICFSLPLGVLLALGRRSTLPVIKSFCVILFPYVV